MKNNIKSKKLILSALLLSNIIPNISRAAIVEMLCTESNAPVGQGDTLEQVDTHARLRFKGTTYELTMTTQPNADGTYANPEHFEDAVKDVSVDVYHTQTVQGMTSQASVNQAETTTVLDSCTLHFSNQPINI